MKLISSSKTNVKMRVFKRRGLDQIRTDVDGFADHCLTTRPRDLLKKTKVQLPMK